MVMGAVNIQMGCNFLVNGKTMKEMVLEKFLLIKMKATLANGEIPNSKDKLFIKINNLIKKFHFNACLVNKIIDIKLLVYLLKNY